MHILVIDDEYNIREILKDIFKEEGHTSESCENCKEALEIIKTNKFSLAFLDVNMADGQGSDILKDILEYNIPVVMISGHATIDLAVECLQKGASSFIEKPLDLNKILNILYNFNKKNTQLEGSYFKSIAKSMQELENTLKNYAVQDSKIFILGENGTGKEIIAQNIHELSPRNNKPFIAINCAAIPENLIESELFGHEKGAFTGATARKIGKFELADEGTLFLDEIADMSLTAQVKLLRVLQEMEFNRLGGTETIKINIKVISATNKNIFTEIEQKRFREDLFFRLNVFMLRVPPLRERLEDFEGLSLFLFKSLGYPNKYFSQEALDFLKTLPWNGNIREFKNYIERVSVMSLSSEISLNFAKQYIIEDSKKEPLIYDNFSLNHAKDLFEKNFILLKFQQSDFNVAKTATLLGITPTSLHNKLKKFDIPLKK